MSDIFFLLRLPSIAWGQTTNERTLGEERKEFTWIRAFSRFSDEQTWTGSRRSRLQLPVPLKHRLCSRSRSAAVASDGQHSLRADVKAVKASWFPLGEDPETLRVRCRACAIEVVLISGNEVTGQPEARAPASLRVGVCLQETRRFPSPGSGALIPPVPTAAPAPVARTSRAFEAPV